MSATPLVSVPVPRVVVPSLNVTVPVAALLVTVAVKVIFEPGAGELLEEVKVVAVAAESGNNHRRRGTGCVRGVPAVDRRITVRSAGNRSHRIRCHATR